MQHLVLSLTPVLWGLRPVACFPGAERSTKADGAEDRWGILSKTKLLFLTPMKGHSRHKPNLLPPPAFRAIEVPRDEG